MLNLISTSDLTKNSCSKLLFRCFTIYHILIHISTKYKLTCQFLIWSMNWSNFLCFNLWTVDQQDRSVTIYNDVNITYHLCQLHGPLRRYAKSWFAHAPGMPGTFSPSSTPKETASCRSRHASRHVLDTRAVMHVGIAKVRWRGKRPRYSRRMRSPQFYVPGKRPIATLYDYNPMREVAERMINWDAEDIESILPMYDYPYMDTYQCIGQYEKWCRKRRFPLCNACIHRCPVNIKCKYIPIFPLKNLARKEFTNESTVAQN